MMDLALSTHCIGERLLNDDDIAAIAAAGIRLIEIGSSQDRLALDEAGYVKEIRNDLDRHGMRVVSLHTPHGIVPRYGDLGALAEVTRRKGVNTVRRAASALRRLGGEILSVHPGEWFFTWEEKPDHMRALERSIMEAAEICAERGLRLAVETMRPAEPRIGDDYHDLLNLIERFPPENVGICLDTNHANLRWDLAALVREVGDRLMIMHVSDNDGIEERHWLPFDGVIGWAEFCAALVDVGYSGYLVYEINPDGRALADLARAVRDNFERLIGFLKQ